MIIIKTVKEVQENNIYQLKISGVLFTLSGYMVKGIWNAVMEEKYDHAAELLHEHSGLPAKFLEAILMVSKFENNMVRQ